MRLRKLVIGLFCLLANAASTGAVAQTVNTSAAVPAEAFFGPADIIDSQLSPSGRYLAVTTAIAGGRTGLFVFDLNNKGAASKVVRFVDLDVRSFEWINDERLTFSVIDLESGLGAQRTTPGLYSVKVDGTELRELIEIQSRVRAGSTKATALNWQHVFLQRINDPEEVIIAKLQLNGLREVIHLAPMRLNVNTGRTRSIETNAPDNVLSWLFNDAGEPKLARVVKESNTKIYWRESQKTDWRVILEGPSLNFPINPRFVDANNNLYVEHTGPTGTSVLSKFDFDKNKPEAQSIINTPGFDFQGSPIVNRSTGNLLGMRILTDARTTVWFDPVMKAMQKTADERWPSHVNSLSCRRCGQPDMVVQNIAYSDTDPGQVWLYKAATKEWQPVSKARSAIDPKQMATVDFVRVKARDGLDIPAYITIPKGRKLSDSGPAVVMVHGGPWVRGGEWQWEAEAQFLASRGYLVISPEFRGSTGFGKKHFESSFKQWGQAMQNDIADVTLWAKQKGYANKFCIAGASYGGYSTLMGLVNNPELYQCGIAWVAVTDPLLLLKGSWLNSDDLSDDSRKYSLPDLIGDAEKDVVMLKANSPVEQAARIRAPLLLVYGREDKRVPLEHGTRLRSAMQKAGLEPQWVVYADEGHGFLLKENRLDFAKKMEDFLAANLKNK